MTWLSGIFRRSPAAYSKPLLKNLERQRSEPAVKELSGRYLGNDTISDILEKAETNGVDFKAVDGGRFSIVDDALILRLTGQSKAAQKMAVELAWGPAGSVVSQTLEHQTALTSTTEHRVREFSPEGSYRGQYTYSLNKSPDNTHAHLGEMRYSQTGGGQARETLGGLMESWQSAGAEFATLVAEEVGSYAWLRFGFVPTDWSRLKTKVAKRAEGLDISEDTRSEIASILEENDPKAAWRLAELNETTVWNKKETKLGKALLLNQNWAGRLTFEDGESMGRFQTYSAG